jgi:SAM-dependent methyltransferase
MLSCFVLSSVATLFSYSAGLPFFAPAAAAILNKIPEGSSILDIGCGDGIYFTNPQVMATVRRKQFTIYAIDIDAGAVEICKARVAAAGLDNQVTCEAIDVTKVTQTFDYVLWMESFPVIPSSIFPPLFKHRCAECGLTARTDLRTTHSSLHPAGCVPRHRLCRVILPEVSVSFIFRHLLLQPFSLRPHRIRTCVFSFLFSRASAKPHVDEEENDAVPQLGARRRSHVVLALVQAAAGLPHSVRLR